MAKVTNLCYTVTSMNNETSSLAESPRPSLFLGVLVPLAMTLFGVLASLVIIEIAFRFATPPPPVKWKDRPASYFIGESSLTLQDYPHAPKKPPQTYRIAAIGDSFTFAPYMQFDDAYPKRLERWFNLNNSQSKVEVINYGVPAYSTSHEVPVVKTAIEEGADLIIMQITLNDPEIKPYTPQQLFLDRNKFGELQLEGTIYQYWRSLAFVKTRLHNRETRKNYKKKFFDLFEKEDTWNNFKNSWTKIASIKTERSVPMVAVIFPLFGYPVDNDYPFWPLHEKVKGLLDSLSVPSLDVTEIYRNIPLERLQVLPGEDFHPNEIAHRMAAEAMYKWLAQNKVVPESIVARSQSERRIGLKK